MTAGAQGPMFRVVGEDGAIGAQLVDERWCSRGVTGRRPGRRTSTIRACARTARMPAAPASRYRRTARDARRRAGLTDPLRRCRTRPRCEPAGARPGTHGGCAWYPDHTDLCGIRKRAEGDLQRADRISCGDQTQRT